MIQLRPAKGPKSSRKSTTSGRIPLESPARAGVEASFRKSYNLSLRQLASPRFRLNQVVPLPKAPSVLSVEARGILASLGYPPPRDTSYGFVRHTDYIDRLMSEERSNDWLDLLRRGEPSVVRFWYRESPAYQFPNRITVFPMTELDPPLDSPGMIRLQLDPAGRLRELEAVDDSPVGLVRPPDLPGDDVRRRSRGPGLSRLVGRTARVRRFAR